MAVKTAKLTEKGCAGAYRFGFNGKEKDTKGEWGNLTHYDYGFRIYNPGIGKFLSVDPLSKEYPELTPYQFASNSPILNVDLDGLEAITLMILDYYNKHKPQIDNKVYEIFHPIDLAAMQRERDADVTDGRNFVPGLGTVEYNHGNTNSVEAMHEFAKLSGAVLEMRMLAERPSLGKVRPSLLRIPLGLTEKEFTGMARLIRQNAGKISDDIVIQGSRASGAASGPLKARAGASDLDIAIKVSDKEFKKLVDSFYKTAKSGTSRAGEKAHALKVGKINARPAKLSKLRKQIEEELGKGIDVQISIIRKGGQFDNGAQIQLPK